MRWYLCFNDLCYFKLWNILGTSFCYEIIIRIISSVNSSITTLNFHVLILLSYAISLKDWLCQNAIADERNVWKCIFLFFHVHNTQTYSAGLSIFRYPWASLFFCSAFTPLAPEWFNEFFFTLCLCHCPSQVPHVMLDAHHRSEQTEKWHEKQLSISSGNIFNQNYLQCCHLSKYISSWQHLQLKLLPVLPFTEVDTTRW